jgi:hypothetical protein
MGCIIGDGTPGTQFPTTVAIQHFERGHMIDMIVQVPGSHGATVTEKTIYILYEAGDTQRVTDFYNPAEPQPAPLSPPPGLYEPQAGFGKAWRETPGARERLGWATAPEATPLDAKAQYFEQGLMVDAGQAEQHIYALYNGSGLSGLVDHWTRYDYPGR